MFVRTGWVATGLGLCCWLQVKAGFAGFEFEPFHRSDRLPVLGLDILVGAGFGGEQTAFATYSDGSTSSIEAGKGGFVGGGLRWTPLWYEELFAVGLAVDVGYKSTGIYASNGTIELTRVPTTLTARGLLSVVQSFSLLVGGGGVVEFAPHLEGSGIAYTLDEYGSTAIGGVINAGLLYEAMPHLGVELTGDARFMDMEFSDVTLNANSIGFQCGLHLFF